MSLTVQLTRPDLATAALALAESSRRRAKDDPETKTSRSLARTLHEHLSGGGVLITFTDPEALLLHAALLDATEWTPGGPAHYGDRAPWHLLTPPETLLGRLEA